MQDPSLRDETLESEIRLVGDLVLAASETDEHLTQAQIDEVLGVDGVEPAADAG